MNSPNRPSCCQNHRSSKATILLQILLIIEFIIPSLGEKPFRTMTASANLPARTYSIGSQAMIEPSLPTFSWAAYNDTFIAAGEPAANITNVRLSARSDGNALRNFSNGSNITGIHFGVEVSNLLIQDANGGETNPGTDAYTVFHGIAQLTGNTVLNGSGSNVTLTFSGLDGAKTYTFATTVNNNGGQTEDGRGTKFNLSDFDSAINLSSNGANIFNTNPEKGDDTTSFSTGNNTSNGYIARWVNIKPGSDGDFTVTASRANTSTLAYGPSVFMLAEEDATTTCQTASLTATEDTYLSAYGDAFNYGGSIELQAVNGTGFGRRTALLRWNLPGIPPAATVSSARIAVYVTKTSKIAYGLYNLRRPWSAGVSNGTVGSGANWTATGIDAETWAGAGASDAVLDRFDINLWNSTTTSFTTVNQTTVISLNANGVSVINEWLHGISSNHGLIIQTYEGTTDDLVIASSEAAVANRPTLTVAYCTPTGVDINYFRATKNPAAVQLSWETVNEATLAGFNLYRRELDGKFDKLNPLLIPPEKGGQPEGYAYVYIDDAAELDLRYEYRLEVIETNLEPSASMLAPYWPYSLQLPIIRH